MVTYKEILMGREKEYPLTEEMWRNLADLLVRVNFIRFHYGKPLTVSSGYRPGKYNAAAGGAKRSNHLLCKAVDFADTDRSFTKWCLANMHLLKQAGLYMESPEHATTWVHLQSEPTKNNPFIP